VLLLTPAHEAKTLLRHALLDEIVGRVEQFGAFLGGDDLLLGEVRDGD
jgi:hypothetical protein